MRSNAISDNKHFGRDLHRPYGQFTSGLPHSPPFRFATVWFKQLLQSFTPLQALSHWKCKQKYILIGCFVMLGSQLLQAQVSNCQQPDQLQSSIVTGTTALLSWRSQGNVPEFMLAIRQTNGLWQNYTTTDTFYQVQNLTPNSDHEWRVKDLCNNGATVYNWTYTAYFTTPEADCAQPVNLLATNIGPDFAQLSWFDPAEVPGFQLAFRPTQGGLAWGQRITDTVGFLLDDLIPSTEYEWKVRDRCLPATVFNWTEPDTFMTTSLFCAPPTNLQSTAITPNSALLSWTTVVAVDSFQIAYRVKDVGANWSTRSSNTHSYLLENLFSDKAYEWKVRDRCAPFTMYDWTESVDFNTLTSISLHSSEKVWKIYPNPTKRLLNMERSSQGPVSISIWDVQGRKLENLNTVPRPTSSFQIDLQQYNPGIYFLKIQSQDETDFYKISKH